MMVNHLGSLLLGRVICDLKTDNWIHHTFRFGIGTTDFSLHCTRGVTSHIAKFMGPRWGPPGSCRPQMGPLLAPWTLLSGYLTKLWSKSIYASKNKVLKKWVNPIGTTVGCFSEVGKDTFLTLAWCIYGKYCATLRPNDMHLRCIWLMKYQYWRLIKERHVMKSYWITLLAINQNMLPLIWTLVETRELIKHDYQTNALANKYCHL